MSKYTDRHIDMVIKDLNKQISSGFLIYGLCQRTCEKCLYTRFVNCTSRNRYNIRATIIKMNKKLEEANSCWRLEYK